MGDLILDFAGEAALPAVGGQGAKMEDGRLMMENGRIEWRAEVRHLVFVVNGKAYVAKQIGEKLAQSWDVTVQERQLFRSVLVRVAT